MNIFVDTCIWWDWLILKNEMPFSKDFNRASANSFNKIYQRIASQGEVLNYLFLYNSLIEQELPKKFVDELPFCFNDIKEHYFMRKIPVPYTRMDGIYKYDGSFMCGGRFGGTLRTVFQTNDRYNHEAELKRAYSNSSNMNPLDIKTRRKEFDIEHLESALEANADYFLTSDERLIRKLENTRNRLRKLENARNQYKKVKEVELAMKLCIFPRDLLVRIKVEDNS